MKFLLSIEVDTDLENASDLATDLLSTPENYDFSEKCSVNIKVQKEVILIEH